MIIIKLISIFCFNLSFSNNQVLKKVDELNKDPNVHGIIVQLPPDSSEPIDPSACTNAVVPEKDVDGWGSYSIGYNR